MGGNARGRKQVGFQIEPRAYQDWPQLQPEKTPHGRRLMQSCVFAAI
jgi:hypothetical protein